MSHDDFAVDPIPGLPENLPPGEQLLWQGKPQWGAVAVRVMHVRKVAIYFALLWLWSIGEARLGGADWIAALGRSGVLLALLAAASVGVLTLMAYWVSRTTIYSITSARVVLRLGIALPITVNLPFTAIEGVALRRFGDDTGDLPLALTAAQRMSYVLLWPHARPWSLSRVQPALRAVPDAERVAKLLTQALKATLSAQSAEVGAPDMGGTAGGSAIGAPIGDVNRSSPRNPVPA